MPDWDPLGKNLILVFCPPRSGSTMLRMMLEAHSRVSSGAEPHVLVPLRYTGYLDQPQKADYDVVNTSLGLREFIDDLPDGRSHYFDACRAYAGTLYHAAIQASQGSQYFVDKTPENVLAWPFITQVFPDAKYVVLARHPLAVLHSHAQTFFSGRYDLACQDNMLAQYIPAIASFLRDSKVQRHTVTYEDLVSDPETQARQLLSFLGLEFESGVVNYGQAKTTAGATGDPIAARRHNRPVTESIQKWVHELSHNKASLDLAIKMVAAIPDEDLREYGYDRANLLKPLGDAASAPPPQKKRWSGYLLQRRIYLALRSSAQRGLFRRMLQRIRYYCDVLLRE